MHILQGDKRPGIRGALANVFRFSIHSLWLGSVATLLSLPAQAQVATTTPETENAPLLEQVIITGSRIPVSSNLSSTSPIQAVSSQEIDMEGHSDTTDVLNALPQNVMNAAVDFGNHSNPLAETGGIATVDLRGLGPQRTLVLVDGRRLGVGDASTLNPNPAPDLNQIPSQLVERVDIVTGGASAVYGSDAIAGVVNFVMKHNFQGIEIDGQAGVDEHSN